jgi:hypothetical protein
VFSIKYYCSSSEVMMMKIAHTKEKKKLPVCLGLEGEIPMRIVLI